MKPGKIAPAKRSTLLTGLGARLPEIWDACSLAPWKISANKTKTIDGGIICPSVPLAHIIPAEIPEKICQLALSWAEKSYNYLNCRGIIRADFRFDQVTNKLYLLEINTHPGMTETSLIPEQAEYCGISFLELIKLIMEVARCD